MQFNYLSPYDIDVCRIRITEALEEAGAKTDEGQAAQLEFSFVPQGDDLRLRVGGRTAAFVPLAAEIHLENRSLYSTRVSGVVHTEGQLWVALFAGVGFVPLFNGVIPVTIILWFFAAALLWRIRSARVGMVRMVRAAVDGRDV
jgi:hypothetical protein